MTTDDAGCTCPREANAIVAEYGHDGRVIAVDCPHHQMSRRCKHCGAYAHRRTMTTTNTVREYIHCTNCHTAYSIEPNPTETTP